MSEVSRKSHIDGVLSTHFDECSIAAADTARLAHEAFRSDQEKLRRRELQPVGRFAAPQLEPFDSLIIGKATSDHPLVVGGEMEIVLLRHSEFAEIPLSLAVIFNNDMVLPVATFEPRTHGECSYVQLGQEIDVDNLVVTVDSPRVKTVEAIRSFLNPDNEGSCMELDSLIASELEEYESSVLELLGPAVCRQAQRYFETFGRGTLRTIQVLNDDIVGLDNTAQREVSVSGITFNALKDGLETLTMLDGRKIQILLARSQQPDLSPQAEKKKNIFRRQKHQMIEPETEEEDIQSDLELYVVTRGDVAFKVAHFSRSGVVFEGTLETIADLDKLAGLMLMLDCEAEALRQDIERVQSQYLIARLKGYTSIFLDRDGITLQTSRWNGYEDSAGDPSLPWPQFKAQLSKCYKLKSSLKDALDPSRKDEVEAFCELFSISDNLNNYLGPGLTATERVVARLGALATGEKTEYEGILAKRKAGKTVTDVQTTLTITENDGKLRAVVKGRPVALEGFEPAVLFDEVFTERGINSVNEETVIELEGVIEEICAKKDN